MDWISFFCIYLFSFPNHLLVRNSIICCVTVFKVKIYSWNDNYDTSAMLFLKIILTILSVLWVNMNIWVYISIYIENVFKIMIQLRWLYNHIVYCGYFNNIKSSRAWTKDVTSFIYIIFSFIHHPLEAVNATTSYIVNFLCVSFLFML